MFNHPLHNVCLGKVRPWLRLWQTINEDGWFHSLTVVEFIISEDLLTM